jgi:hypothetical protein
MRIRTIIAAIAAPAALAAVLLGTAVAPAAHAATATAGPGSNGTTNNTLTGNKSPDQTYVDGVFGKVKVNETQHPAFDTVSAKFVDGQTMTPNTTGQVGWNSDFGSHAGVTGTLTYTINATGTGYTGQATYPAS